jgi:vitamin B12 transporter
MYGNPDLKPEHGVSGDFGFEYSRQKIRFSATAFFIDSKDLIAWEYDPLTWETRVKNLDKARQYGVELEGGHIINSILSHKLNYTYLNAKDASTKKELPYRAAHTLNYSLTFKPIENLSLSASVYYKDKVFTNAANTVKLDGFFTFDFNLNYTANEYLSLWIKGINVGDSKYELTADYPMPGAAVYGGICVKFWQGQ